MKYKLVFLTIILILLSGCNATYNLEIGDDNFSYETLTSTDYIKYYSEEDLEEVIPTFFTSNSDISYEIDENGNLVITRFKYDYKELNNNKEINDYFGKVSIDSKKISFKPDYEACIFMFLDGGEYVSNDKVKINVTLPFNVAKSNADSVVDNTYIWTYGIDDCEKEAYIELKSSTTIYFIIGGLLLIGLVIYFIIKRKKNNDIS